MVLWWCSEVSACIWVWTCMFVWDEHVMYVMDLLNMSWMWYYEMTIISRYDLLAWKRWYEMCCYVMYARLRYIAWIFRTSLCVRVCIEDSLLEDFLIKLGYEIQWVEIGLRARGDWVPKAFSSPDINSGPRIWIYKALCKVPSWFLDLNQVTTLKPFTFSLFN